MNLRTGDQRGFSLVEASIAMAIGVIFLASVTSTWFTATKVFKEEEVRSELRIGIEKAIERMKQDVRLSDSNGILFYPVGASTYTAVSLPASAPGAGGFLTFSGGLIQWNRTVIYHVYDTAGRSELRRTYISSFNSNAVTRQTQLNTCVSAGTISGASTTTLFKTGTAALEISPQVATFDGYASSLTHSGSTNFGSIQLATGTHEIRFQVTGKNASSSGYGIGIDSISLAPSGCVQEAEALTISASSGATPATEDMSSYGVNWGGNEQVHFPSTAAGHYVEFSTTYDQWLESNFSSATHSDTSVSAGADPLAQLSSREVQSLTLAWTAASQTVGGDVAEETVQTPMSVRVPVQAGYIVRSGVMMRVKFVAGNSGPLTIGGAWFGPAAAPGSMDMAAMIPLYFDSGTVPEGGTDGVGATAYPGVSATVSIPPGEHAWSNWFIYPLTTGGGTEYLVSMSIPGNVGEWATNVAPNPLVGPFSYRTSSSADAATASWALLTPTTSSYALAATEIAAWQSSGTVTSQIYDTTISAPNFGEIAWDATLLPAGSTADFKVRSSASSSMAGATDWSLLPSYASSPSSLLALASQRYVQFQATLTSAAPYTGGYPSVDDVQIDWSAQTGLVEINGNYTKRPNYGQFEVLVDGNELVKALELKVTASDTYRGQVYSYSLNTEQDPMNTGK